MEQIPDQPVDAFTFIIDDLKEGTPRLLIGDFPAQQCFRKSFYGSDRRLEVMGDVRHKITSHILKAFDVGDVMEHKYDAPLLPAVAVVRAEMCIEALFDHFACSDFFLDFFILLKNSVDAIAQSEVVFKIPVVVSDDVLVVLTEEFLHGGVDHQYFTFLVDEHDPAHHVGQDGGQLLLIFMEGAHLVLKVHGKVVDRRCELTDLTGHFCMDPAAVILAAQALRHIDDVADGPGDAPCQYACRNRCKYQDDAEEYSESAPEYDHRVFDVVEGI